MTSEKRDNRDTATRRLLAELDVALSLTSACSIALHDLDDKGGFGRELTKAAAMILTVARDVSKRSGGGRPSQVLWPRETSPEAHDATITREHILGLAREEIRLVALILDDAARGIADIDLKPEENIAQIKAIKDILLSIDHAIVADRDESEESSVEDVWERLASLDPAHPSPTRPVDRENALERISGGLAIASSTLSDCAGLIRELDLDPGVNIRRIGEALAALFEIDRHIYDERPDLVPDYLKDTYLGKQQSVRETRDTPY